MTSSEADELQGTCFCASSSTTSYHHFIQKVEKTCSIVMAVSFLIFNGIYWPWLFQEDDFDSARYSSGLFT